MTRPLRPTGRHSALVGVAWLYLTCFGGGSHVAAAEPKGFSDYDRPIGFKLDAAAVRDCQGDRLSDPLSFLACAKHYAGDGGTSVGIDTLGNKLLDRGVASRFPPSAVLQTGGRQTPTTAGG